MRGLIDKLPGIAAIGCSLGLGTYLNPPQVAEVTLTAAVAGAALTGFAPSLASSLGLVWWAQTRARLLEGSREVNHDLQHALAEAFPKAIASLERRWWDGDAGDRMRAEEPDLAERVARFFEELRRDASLFCTPDMLGRAAGEVRGLLECDPAAADDRLASDLREYFDVDEGDPADPAMGR